MPHCAARHFDSSLLPSLANETLQSAAFPMVVSTSGPIRIQIVGNIPGNRPSAVQIDGKEHTVVQPARPATRRDPTDFAFHGRLALCLLFGFNFVLTLVFDRVQCFQVPWKSISGRLKNEMPGQ